MRAFLNAFLWVLTRPFWCSFSGVYQTYQLKRALRSELTHLKKEQGQS